MEGMAGFRISGEKARGGKLAAPAQLFWEALRQI
jgi:hypothetical protein